MLARSHVDLHNTRLGIDRVKKLSDRIVGVGPIGIGLDGILGFVPGLGVAYSLIAGAMLLSSAVRARASAGTLLHMGGLLAVDALLDVPAGTPVLGLASSFADTLFTGHKWSANLLLKHMDDTIYIEGTREKVKDRPEYAELLARIRAGKEKRRIVFLG